MSENNYPIMQQDNAKGATALQAQVINVYPNGITEEKCREICLSVYKDNIISLQDEAKDIAYQRAEQLTDKFVEKLSKQNDEIRKKIEEQLKEPAMQEAIFKSQKCYALSNDEDHLTILTNMLIEKASNPLRTNKQMLIDDAIDIMPRLNQKHLDVLSFFASLAIIRSPKNENSIDWYIDNLIHYLKKINPIESLVYCFDYLSLKKCLEDKDFFRSSRAIEDILSEIPCIHSGFPKDEYFNEINISGAEKLIDESLLNKENIVIKYSSEELKSMLKGPDEIKEKIIEFEKKNIGPKDKELIKQYLQEKYPEVKNIYDNWNLLSRYKITSLGRLVAFSYMKVKYGYEIRWDFE